MRHQSLLAGAALAVVSLLAAGAVQAQDAEPATTITWKGAPELKWGDFTLKPRGRVFLDYVTQDVDRATGLDFGASESRIRTARLGFQGSWADQWSWVAEASIANGEANWEDLLLEYSPSENTAITVGNFKSLSLENLTSSRYTTFMERGPFNDLIDAGRVMTLAARTGGDNWSVAGGVHGDNINDPSSGGDEQRGVFARAHFAPVVTDDTKIHLGVWARDRDRGDDSAFRYRVRNNTNFGDRYTDAGSSPLGAGDSDTAIGIEAAAVWRSFSVQGDWASVDADLTEFAGVATAGEYSAVTVGATWYPFPYVRFMANYTDSKNEAQVAASDVDVQTLQVRAQFDF